MNEPNPTASQGGYNPATVNETGGPKRKPKTPLIIAVIVVVLSCLCVGICTIAGGWGVVSSLVKASLERDNVEAVIDEFMRAMMARDVEAAYGLFSTRAQRQTPISSVEEMAEGGNYPLFEGYQSTSVDNIEITVGFNTDQDLPQGTVAEITGSLVYEGGFTGTVTAVLEQENNKWRLHNINITVPPDKFGSPE